MASSIKIKDNIIAKSWTGANPATNGIFIENNGAVLVQASSAIPAGGLGASGGLFYGITNDAASEVVVYSQLSTEISRASSAETSLSTGLSSEISRASSAETSLSTGLSTEVSRASSAETSLSTGLSTEVSRASSAETSLSTGLSTEVSRASSAETSLSTGLSTEVSRASSAETSLSTGLSTEVSRASSAETSLSTGLSSEISRVDAAFSGTSGYIAALTIGSGIGKVFINTNSDDGDINAGSFTSASDARLKKDVEEISNGLDIVLQMRPVSYNWISGRKNLNPEHKEVGFIAQELEALFPNIVRTMPEGEGQVENQKTVAYDRMVSVIVAAIKELNAKVEAMKAAMKA